MIFRPCRGEEAIKPMKYFFSSPWRISLSEELLLHAEQEAAAQRWRRGPPEQTQCGTRQPGQASPVKFMTLPPLCSHTEASHRSFWISTFCHLCLALLPLPFLPHIPLLHWKIHSSFSNSLFGITFSIHLQTSWPAAHPDTVSMAIQAMLHLKSCMQVFFFSSAATLSHLCVASFN